MGLATTDEAMLCKVFPSTLSEKALTQLTSLKANNIDSCHSFEKIFLDKFSTIDEIPKTRGNLTNVKQQDNESLFDYLERF